MHTSIVASCGNRVVLRKLGLAVLAFAVTFGLPLAGRAVSPPSVTLTPSVASPQMLGTPVTWTAAVQNAPAGHTYGYQFSVTYNGQAQLVQDFSPTATFTWVPHTVEGAYQFTVVARDTTTTPYVLFAPVSVNFTLQPWVTAPLAAGVVNPTAHPLVALFSGPPCTVGHQLLVRFRPASSSVSMTTNLVPCSQNSANFLVAGMYPSTPYLMHWEEYNGTTLVNTGTDLPFTTRALPSSFHVPTYQVNVPATAQDAAYPVVFFQTSPSTATDLAGNLLWYGPTAGVVRVEPGGTFYAFPGGQGGFGQYDLGGNLLLQTNVEIMNEQLVAQGYPTILTFNSHEGRNLPNGNIGVLAYRDVVSTSAQGGTPTNPVDIIGSMILVLDHNLQLLWAWDSFAHQDINRAATLGDTCTQGSGGCTTFNPAFTVANDWLHSNAIEGTTDGNIIISERSQDWILKINYANGTGDGSVIWHMGAGGDFTITNPPAGSCTASTIPGDPNIIPWFTHQHDPSFPFEQDASGNGFEIMTVFDDGNTREADCPAPQDSRGIVMLVNEPAREITYATVADLGAYSPALGAAQLLTPEFGNITASFDNGLVDGGVAQETEVNLAGQIVYQIQTNSISYRTYRMQNLYTPTEFESNASTGRSSPVLPPDQPFNFTSGFAQDQDSLQFNGSASLTGNSLELTSGGTNQAGSVFYTSPVDITSFTADFGFQLTNAAADGFTFTIQNVGPTAVGSAGSYLGYRDIGQSVAIKFDLFQNPGDPSGDCTGLFEDGALPVGGIDLTGSGINLHSGDSMDAHITYDGTTLTLTITDLMTLATWSHPFLVNIPAAVGGNTAYIGFTGGTGGETSVQQILNWSYQPGQAQAPYDPTGIPSVTGLTLNGSASLSGTTLQLTNGGLNEAGSAFYTSPVDITSFNTNFKFLLTNPAADGFTFTIQDVGPTALGAYGSYLGYRDIGQSVAIKFDLYQNPGDPSNNCTGVFEDGALPIGGIDLTGSGINLHSGDTMDANIAYDGEALTLTITDTVTNATWSHPFVINIPSTIGANSAYVGFTAGTGGLSSTQQILNWTFE